MNGFLDFVSEPGRSCLVGALIFVSSVVVAYFVRLVWSHVFLPLARRTRTDLDRLLLEATRTPVYLLLMAYGFYFAVQYLVANLGLTESLVLKVLTGLAYISLVLGIALVATAIIRSFFHWFLKDVASKTQTPVDEQFVRLLGRVIQIVVYFIAATVILSYFKVNISGFLATAGVASLAVALAAQETLANMISGFMLILDKPFRVGDWIQLASGEMGIVQEIGLRTTKILSFDHTLLIVPNAEIAKNKVINRNYPDLKIKVRQTIGVAYGTDLEKVKRILQEICLANEKVLKEPPPVVFFTEFGESSLNLLLVYWIGDLREQFLVTDQVNMEIKRRFEAEGIVIPFPQRDVHLYQ
ncbi:MAG TPA: mechanosensitive ion channel [bacterium]|nr:mechanosensitive ion channel [bacterium]HOL66662.1 mechanosensitive ion channel [bacterium]HPP12444.1 mechanosensitive ion channel [bacterium]